VDPTGNAYVVDTANHRIQKFTGDGSFLSLWGSSGTGNGQFFSPFHLFVATNGDVFVADSENHRIQKFAAPVTAIAPTTWGHLRSMYR
jgi:hypothetical protein